MKALVWFTMSMLSGAAIADEASLPEASKGDIQQLVHVCKQMAEEDEVSKNEMHDYLLDCVNEQLTEMGYQRIDALPKDK